MGIVNMKIVKMKIVKMKIVKMKRRRNGRRGLVEGGGQWEPNGVETFLSWHLRNLPLIIIIIVVKSSKAHHKNAKLSC